ncbi:hypothetical protein TIFTF001_018760 [Ficus carica]|uniref:DUF8039 domain-containing protein n=1 Tax=Ficus carica TaxID=3494 RepID=A0AA88AS84_FICCA|nr:hypothetical protein TIFTF001_018760 [Ficus carica]
MSQHNEEDLSTQTQIGKPRRTNSPRFNPDEDDKRRATLLRRVHIVRSKGERIEVSFDTKGQPLGKEGDELQSWIGVLARQYIPIWIFDFRKSAKNFRYDLYQAFVRNHIDEETMWQRPPKVVHNYPTISQDDWEKFIKYQRTPEFKRLFEQGSEIRKKSKYGSTGGRDGYRKRDQIHFERTGKWAEWHTRWLDMRVKPDGEFKNEAFKIIADTIVNDILTKALGNAKHSDRIRGQSKFVKQSQYFNLMQSSMENDEVSDMKRQLAALERTVHELFTKHGINRETMAKEMTTPTIDQHNSFKASCTMNEKEARPSDPAYMDCVPIDTVHGIPLGEENVRVTITVPKLKRALLPIPTNEATCIEETVCGFVAWPKRLVVVQTSLS